MVEKICPNCSGGGSMECSECDSQGELENGSICPECDGLGECECDWCNGEGTIEED